MKIHCQMIGSCLLTLLSLTSMGQNNLPEAKIRNLRGAMVPFSTAVQKDSLILICFWATTSDESINELNSINANYDKWKSEVPFKMMAVSVDEGKTANKVRPTVNMNEWKFDVFVDIQGELRKALGSNNLPQSMIVKKFELVYEQSGYEPGSENYLVQKLKAIAAKR
ncbi:MAG TPA: redoxin domain-containing protein [Puia sp.]|nr:redoxin domain-containing protein [Puia sp.]